MVANERGQLLLIGGVAIAIVVFSTILFAHSLAVTDGITTTGSADTIERTADREASIERDLGRLAAETRGDDLDGFEERYEYALENYTRTHNRVVASNGGTYLNATLNESASRGNIVNLTRDSNNDFKNPSGPPPNNWTVAKNVSYIAAFNFTANKTDNSGKKPIIIVNGNGSGSIAVKIDQKGSSGHNVSVNGTTQCSGNGTAHIDLVKGSCTVGSNTSSFISYHDLDAPYSVEIKNGHKATGTSRFAAAGTFSNHTSPPSYPVVPAVDMTYDTPSASYNRTVLVEVDDG